MALRYAMLSLRCHAAPRFGVALQEQHAATHFTPPTVAWRAIETARALRQIRCVTHGGDGTLERERMEQVRVKLGDIVTHDYGSGFAPLSGETLSDVRKRLLDQEVEQAFTASDIGKFQRYAAVMAAGGRLPPVFLCRLDDELYLSDGWHRAAASASLGRKTVSAVVFNVRDSKEADIVSELAYELSEASMPWIQAVRVIAAALSIRDVPAPIA